MSAIRRPNGYENYTFPFTVTKPWGKEIWLELLNSNGRGYCFKQIEIKSGMRTSFQYHEKKCETNMILKGKAEIWLENGNEIKRIEASDGYSFTVQAQQKHRIIALTDLVLLEVSTPEVDDVIRIQDDSNRKNGKIESEHL